MKGFVRSLAHGVSAGVRNLAQELADRIDLARSRSLPVEECATVCLALGPYRNLTTLTTAVLFLHPHCQVLNHAGERIFGRRQIDFLSDFSPRKLHRFIQFASLISTKGKKGDHGGSITHSHAFDPKYRMKELHSAAGAGLLKDTIKCLFWKESLRTSNLIRSQKVDLGRIFAEDEGRVRFLMPIRNPMDCAVSNLKTGHVRLFTGLPEKPDAAAVTQAVLEEIRWVGELQEQYPGRFFYFFEHEVSAGLLHRMAAFLKLEPLPAWIDAALAAMKISDGYRHGTDLVDTYKRTVSGRFGHLPALQEGLLRFCA